MKRYLHHLVLHLSLEVEAEDLHTAEMAAAYTELGRWNWDETLEESVQQFNDGLWGPVLDDNESDFPVKEDA